MSFSPVLASKNIVQKYKRYLSTIFDIRHPVYAKQFKAELERQDTFAKGPYLDVTDAFVKGRSIRELIDCGKLPRGFEKIHMPLTRPLYLHQEEAILKADEGRNLVVATGTGSGKTESFLIPILRHLIEEHETGRLTPGVRALIIYPMNALANDQMERLRTLLSGFPEITYGSYTGQTKHKFEEALDEYRKLNDGDYPLGNELISRVQMKDKPPHILITNYAMLEYLMIRPEDHVFFDGPHADHWKYIILDEAHVYTGSTGIEVSMLLRRLKARLQKDRLQYILTSATLGGEGDNDDVASFAANLCDQDFEARDVVRAKRMKLEPEHELSWLPESFYRDIAKLFHENAASRYIAEALRPYRLGEVPEDRLEETLYDLVLHDRHYWRIRQLLSEPMAVASLASALDWSQEQVEDFVTVATRCEKNGDRLFDARYHMFLRATDSVFVTLQPNNRLFLTRKKIHMENGVPYKVFEIATCSVCHAIYLVGKIENHKLEQHQSIDDEIKTVFYLGEQVSDSDADHTLDDENLVPEAYDLCCHCGTLVKSGSMKQGCEHPREAHVRVQKMTRGDDKKPFTKCVSCENTNQFGILRMFFTGHEAVTSVIGTALFEELPAYEEKKEVVEVEDESGFGFGGLREFTTRTNLAKQFIAFSDSRQAAAFYSSYLDQTYRNILYKRLIVEVLRDPAYGRGGKSFYEFVEDLVYQFEQHGIKPEGLESARKEAWKAALLEMVDNQGATSLYSMGLMGFSLHSNHMRDNTKYGLSREVVSTICNVFATGMMTDAAVYYNYNLNAADREYFTYNGIEYKYTFSDANPRTHIRSFIPSSAKSHMSNRRIDYLHKVMEKTGVPFTGDDVGKLMGGFWQLFERLNFLKNLGGTFKIDLQSVIVHRGDAWYRCIKCARVTIHNAIDVCPTYKCDGTLERVEPGIIFADNHYYRLYNEMDIREMRVVEHTAQLDRETAYEYQKRFKQKEIDILSCSTTFEMGVDVGTLETVFMRNMPPSPANYAQRAGRAGRSKQSAAYALTFCTKSSHDFSYFKYPERMIKGNIKPPKFVVLNEKIAIRHLFASALAHFWRVYPEYFSTAYVMADSSYKGRRGVEMLAEYLDGKPADLKHFLHRFLPELLLERLGVDTFAWVPKLLSSDQENPGVLTKAIWEYEYEVRLLKEAIDRYLETRSDPNQLVQRLNVFERENVLNFLSRKNVLPKYGFPIDTVELGIHDRTNRVKLGLQLQRDLFMAISEYAPDSQIVANGHLITSRYIRKVPTMSWRQYDYIQCETCRTLNIDQHVEEDEYSQLNHCRSCKADLDVGRRRVFLMPEFGFEADGNRITRPGLRKPKRTFRSEIAYVGFKSEIESYQYQIGRTIVELGMSQSDELAALNNSNFYVCEYCGYTLLKEEEFNRLIKKPHKTPSGYSCKNDGSNRLKRFALGYRFETDVVQLKFLNLDLADWNQAVSVLHGILKGVSTYLNIEQNDIAGCLQYFHNELMDQGNYGLILYDRTPGGAGHVRRLNHPKVLEGVLKETLYLMEDCDCGGEDGDSSCYTCLRGYYNQKYHDILNRRDVIVFLKRILEK
jgi:hypothetical protein